jgi:glycerophosphoryl diester phosphodiesterase
MKKKTVKILIAVALAAAVIAAAVAVYVVCFSKPKTIMPKETVKLSELTSKTDGVKLIAHRGLSGIAPENTLPAFEKAGQNGYFGVECDVRMTKDGKWVIMHDFDTKRMCYKFKAVSSSEYDELLSLDVKNGANIERYENTKIPTVEQYLEVCVEYSLTPVIEIKNSDCSLETVQSLYDAVYSVDGLEDVIFISFTQEAIENIRKIDKNSVCYLLVNEMKKEQIDYCVSNGFGIDFNANNKKLTDETLQYAVDSGITLSCWTVDTKETLERMLTFGILIYTTNRILPEE